MSEIGPSGEGNNPFGSFLGELMRMFVTEGPLNWPLARQAALVTATGGVPEPNVDPIERLRLEELLRVADLHVSDATGLATAQTSSAVSLKAVTRAEWAYYTLDAYRPLFEALATALTQTQGPVTPPPELAEEETGLLGNLPQVLGPVMLGAQAGSLAGFLARRALGQYDLPIPRPPSDELLIVPATISAFAKDWSLPGDELGLWICVSELTHHAVLGRAHVRARLDSLLLAYVRGFEVDASALDAQLEGLDLSDPEAIQSVLGQPEALLGALQTPGQQDTLTQLGALVAALEGYVDHVLDTTGHHLMRTYAQISEAMRRRRVEATDADRLITQLLGLELGQATFDRGTAFVRGIIERAGSDALARLWHSADELPTPSEVDAPGLWLERINLPRG